MHNKNLEFCSTSFLMFCEKEKKKLISSFSSVLYHDRTGIDEYSSNWRLSIFQHTFFIWV